MTKTIRSNGHVALFRALLEARIRAGFGQLELSSRLRCHQSFVARIEGGQRRVDLFELVVLGRAIGFRSAEILPIVEAATEPDHRI